MRNTIITILLILAALAVFLFLKRINNDAVTLTALRIELAASNDTAKRYRDMYGAEHIIREQNRLNHAAAEVLYKQTIADQAKRLGIRPKQLTEHTSVALTKSGTIEMTVEELDRLIAETQRKRVHDTTDTGSALVYIPYTADIDLKLNKFWKRNRFLFWKHGTFLQAKKHYVDVYSEDQGVKIYDFQNVHIADEYGPFALSLTVGATLPNLKPVAVVGLSYTPKFLRFKKRK